MLALNKNSPSRPPQGRGEPVTRSSSRFGALHFLPFGEVRRGFLFLFLTAITITSCKKETNKSYIYDVNNVGVSQDGVAKPNVKSTVEFISIAYSDLYGNTIDQTKLTDLGTAYNAFGDKKLIEDLIIRNFLNATGVSIPTVIAMNTDVNLFVINTYKKFYNREPNEFELWQMKSLIQSDVNTTPELVYYAFMTSNEYRYY